MKHFLYLQVHGNDGQPGQLLGNTFGNPALGTSPAAAEVCGRRALWRLNDDGTLELGGSFGTVLDADNGGRLHLRARAPGVATWKIDSGGKLLHAASGKGVSLNAALSSNQAVLSDSGNDSSTPAQTYVTALGDAIQAILDMPQAGYTQFQNSQLSAYQWIISQLPMLIGGDLRAEYTRTDFEPGTILTLLTALTYPGSTSFTSADFSTVQSTLSTELTYASAVVTNMGQTVLFWQQVFGDDSGYLDSLQTDLTAASNAPPSVSLVIATLFENILYTAFSLFGAPGGFIANIMATAFNTAVAYMSTHGGGALSFAQLQDNLRIGLDQVLTEIAIQKDTILSNGNMAQSFATFVHQNAPTNTGLNNSKLTAEYVYLLQVLQNVLPGLCTWSGQYFVAANTQPPSGVPSYNSLSYSNSEGNFVFSLQMNSGQAVPQLVSTLLCTGSWIAASGANPAAMFLGLEGWNWTSAMAVNNQFGANALIISIANATTSTFTIAAIPKQGDIEQPPLAKGSTSVTVNLAPSGLAIIVSSYSGGLETKIKITPASNTADSGSDIASFHCHQHEKGLGGAPWVDQLTIAPGYQLPAPVCINRIKAIQSQPGMLFAVLSATS